MCDKELVIEVLRQIEEASAKIIVRFQTIRQVADFTDSPAGVDKMDAILNLDVRSFPTDEKNGGEA